MTPATYDFTRPPRLPTPLKAELAPWLKRANETLAESLFGFGLSVQTQSLSQMTAWPMESQAEWTGKPVAYRVFLNGSPTFLALPNSLVQRIVAVLLGDTPATEISERDLSAVELKLCELCVQEIVKSFLEAWLGETPVAVELREQELNLRRSKQFRPKDPLVVCRANMKVQDQDHCWCWMIRLETLLDLFGTEEPSEHVSVDVSQRKQMESVVRGMKLPLVVKLGQAQLTAPQLAELQVGDVVVLRQRTSDPLKAIVSGRPTYLGWPGQVANKQAFQIETELTK